MAEHEERARRFLWRPRQSPESTLVTTMFGAFNAVLLFSLGVTRHMEWTIYLPTALWAGVAVVWWIRYRRFRTGQRD